MWSGRVKSKFCRKACKAWPTEGLVAGGDRAEEVIINELGLLGADGRSVVGPVLGHRPGQHRAVGEGEVRRGYGHAAAHWQCHAVRICANADAAPCTAPITIEFIFTFTLT